MPDAIGRISVPVPASSGLTFPLVPDYGYGEDRPWPVIVHRFGELAEKAEQRFQVGIGPRRFQFKRAVLSRTDRAALFSFFEQVQGSYQTFTYNAPRADKSTTAFTVIFETQPLTINELANACQVGLTFIEIPDPAAAPTYTVNSTVLRFPSSTLKTALLAQEQKIIALVHIRVREGAVGDIYLSDRRCTIGSQLYLPRVLNLGEPGSDVIMSQNINGAADNVQFTFGNADRVMTRLANDTDLKYASIDLSLFHVNSGILLQLWKGFIISLGIDGGPQLAVQCSDGFYQVTQQYPPRGISRTCWKTFNDGVNCPYATFGSGGDPTSCDFYFDSPNGCQSHGMANFFGGHPAQPQGVRIKDNSTGVAGFGRNTVTATSIISDTIWGQALPENWCNDDGDPGKALIINAPIVAGRDEGDFYDAFGIVGCGPIGSYTGTQVHTNADGYQYIISPLLDGFTPHGFKVDSQLRVTSNSGFGLREVIGNDPVNPATDSFSLGQGTPQRWGPQMAAGTAFVEIRRVKPSGITPTPIDQHQMQIPVSLGLAGWTWDASGTRSSTAGLTNPFWIAVNSFLRALGMNNANSADQLALFVRSSLFAGDGTGTAEIADLSITPLFGGGTEIQFRFQGTIAQQKPFRDWLTEILACGLGYFTWEFGQLKLGCRINASAVEAFTLGNTLFQSLRLTLFDAAFEHLVIDFADRDYQFQANTAEYQDKSHAAYYGRAGAPLTARQHAVGSGTLSQTSRMAVVRTREEIGGINPTEWKNARNATWKTTILALNTEVGQVVSHTHPDIPTGSANFRIQSWRLFKDYSIEIAAKTVTPSMYDLTVGPKPADVTPPPLPVLFYPVPSGPAWAPFQIQASATDALFPSEWTFDLGQSYTLLADDTILARATAIGKLPVNDFIANCGAPVISSGGLSISTTGGFIPGGVTLRVSISANDANGHLSPPSLVIIVQIPAGTNTNSFTLTGIQWPLFAGLTGYFAFISDKDDLICEQQAGPLTDTGGAVYTPTSVTVNGPFIRSTWGLPDGNITNVRLKGKRLVHGGVLGAPVDSVATNQIVAGQTIDVTASDNWMGRVLAIIGRNNGFAPYVSFNITAFDAATGTFTLDQDPVAAGVLAGDAFVVCFRGYDNSASSLILSDAGLVNADSGHLGLTPHTEGGYVARIIKGTGRGSPPVKIVDNGNSGWNLASPLVINTDSVWVIEQATWPYTVDSSPIDNGDYLVSTSLSMATDNDLGLSILVGGFTVDTNQSESLDGDAPVRMLYVYGNGNRFIETDKATFGLEDDTIRVPPDGGAAGTNAAGKYYNVHHEGQPFIGSISCVKPPVGADTILDVLYSNDDGNTWGTIFPTGVQIHYTPSDVGKVFLINFVNPLTFMIDKGLLRIDVIQSGGALGIETVIKWGVPRGQTTDNMPPSLP